jgi:hypothetical protein
MVISYVSSIAFVRDDHQLALYFELRVSVCVITMFKLRCICDTNFYVIYDGDR